MRLVHPRHLGRRRLTVAGMSDGWAPRMDGGPDSAGGFVGGTFDIGPGGVSVKGSAGVTVGFGDRGLGIGMKFGEGRPEIGVASGGAKGGDVYTPNDVNGMLKPSGDKSGGSGG